MKTTFYEKIASLLIALLILGGAFVLILLGLWLSAQAFARPTAVAVTLVPFGNGAGTLEDEFDPNVLDPGMEYEQDEPSFLESLESVDNIVAQNAALLSDSSEQDDTLLLPGAKRGEGRTRGDGTGLAGKPRRWEFHFGQGATVEQYAEILDALGIELGVLRSNGKVVYAAKLSSKNPTTHEGESTEEKRYYMTLVKGDTEKADREILTKANIETEGRIILKFLSLELEADLANQERDQAGHRASEVKGSFFRVVRNGELHKLELYHQVF